MLPRLSAVVVVVGLLCSTAELSAYAAREEAAAEEAEIQHRRYYEVSDPARERDGGAGHEPATDYYWRKEEPRRIRYWELLMMNPRGATVTTPPPHTTCKAPGAPCSANTECCAGSGGKVCYNSSHVTVTAPATCCDRKPDFDSCTVPDTDGGSTECCGGNCGDIVSDNSSGDGTLKCCKQVGTRCDPKAPRTDGCCETCENRGEGFVCAQGCFSAATKVVVRGVDTAVELQDLRVGQHVLCYDGGMDMLTPGAPQWCEVKNFFRAADEMFPDMVRITFRTADGTLGSTTVSWLHIMHLITDPQPKQEAATPRDFGSWAQDVANNVRPGQLIPVPTTGGFNTTYKPAVIEVVERVTALGKYIPVVEHPYLLADGLVHPIWPGWPRLTRGWDLAIEPYAGNALRHMMHAPLWMSDIQPKGTRGKFAQWDGNSRSPLMRTLTASIEGEGSMPVSGKANFTRALEWFVPRYQAWKADPSKAITETDVLSVWPTLFEGASKGAHVGDPQSCMRYTACEHGLCAIGVTTVVA